MKNKLIVIILILLATLSIASSVIAEDYDEPIGNPIKKVQI